MLTDPSVSRKRAKLKCSQVRKLMIMSSVLLQHPQQPHLAKATQQVIWKLYLIWCAIKRSLMSVSRSDYTTWLEGLPSGKEQDVTQNGIVVKAPLAAAAIFAST